MNKVRRAIKEEPDRVATDILFIAFGVAAFFQRPRSFDTTPVLFATLFNIEFIIIGVVLLVGTVRRDYRLKMIGFGLYILALVTTAALISWVGQSVVSLLILAFAIRGYTSIKEMRLQRQFLADLRETLRSPPKDEDGTH
jgi:hypothetical protein